MRYKLLFCAFILLIATPALAQEFSPIVVETGKPIPSIVKSGEPFGITYRAKFLDTVIIYEEQMNFNGLALVEEKKPKLENSVTGNAEVISLNVVKERVSNDVLGFVNVWDFTYTFRIIQPEKGLYKIPSFNFVWVLKRAGVTKEEAKDKEKPREFPTEEVGISYVSSIVKPPPLDIRDEISFVSPVASGVVLRRWAYGLIGIASLLAMTVVFRFSRYSKTWQSQEASRETAETADGDMTVTIEPILLPKQARKKFLRELNKLQDEAQHSTLGLEKKIRLSVRSLLLAELRGMIRDSMSENEIYAKLDGLDTKQKKQIGPRYEYALDLAQRLKRYQGDIDSGRYSLDNVKEINELRETVSSLKLHRRVSVFVKCLARNRQ